jgi:hypothetical protein
LDQTSVTPGKIGQAIMLDGGGNTWTPDPISGVLDFGDGQAFSISFWMNIDSTNIAGILSKASTDVSQGYMLMHENGNLIFHLNDATNDCGWNSWGNVLPVNEWIHIAWVITADRQSSAYLNGVLIREYTCSSVGSLANSDGLAIGYAYSGAHRPFNGDVDDVRIYNRTLSITEITNLYNMGR